MQISLAGKLALVTGAGSGIGRGIARALAGTGAAVVVNDINIAGGQQTVEAITSAGGKAMFVAASVASENECAGMMRAVAEAVRAGKLGTVPEGALHVVVNNAAVELFKGIAETTDEEWDRVVAVDLKSLYVVTRAALPMLRRAGAGGPGSGGGAASVINIASIHAVTTLAQQPVYAACKGGIVAMTRAMALELGPMGVTVNSISPGYIDTPMVQQWFDLAADPGAERKRVAALHAVGRIGTPEDIGHLVAFLASPYARFITGSNIGIDGGVTALLQH